MTGQSPALRVALVAGTLARGGAEKQLFYMAEALVGAGVEVRAYSPDLTGHFAEPLRSLGIPVVGLGAAASPPRRAVTLARALRAYRPHLTQAGHFYTNLYVLAGAMASGSADLGAVRSDVHYDVASTGPLGRPSLRLPRSLLVNSHAARRNAMAAGVAARRIHLLPNVIRLSPAEQETGLGTASGRLVAAFVGRLVPAKRVDRFLIALARARVSVPELTGLVVGQGPERERLVAAAETLGLGGAVEFAGQSTDVSGLLRGVSMLALTSDHEGFPNVLLEAMAAGLPVVTTDAGDAGIVVQDGVTGFVVPYDDPEAVAGALVTLARAPSLRRELGAEGARRVRTEYSTEGLGSRLLATYASVAEQRGRTDLVTAVGAVLTGL